MYRFGYLSLDAHFRTLVLLCSNILENKDYDIYVLAFNLLLYSWELQ